MELKKYRVRLNSGLETVLKLSEGNRARNFPDAVPFDAPRPAPADKPKRGRPRKKAHEPENKAHLPEDK